MPTTAERTTQQRRWERYAADPDAAPLHRVRWRLTVLTVGLLTALLLALGGVVYVTTQHVLMQSLHDTLQARANNEISRFVHSPHFGFAQGPFPDDQRGSGGVFLSIADTNLNVLSAFTNGPAGENLPDPAAAQEAIQGQPDSPWSTQQLDQYGPYLVYTELLTSPIDGSVQAVAQSYMPEQQYLHELHTLLEALIGASLLGLAASAAISYWLARRALQPVKVAMQRQRDFVADAAHELRTPLAIMRTAAELGLGDGTEMDQGAALEQTLEQNAHLTQLVDSLLLLARADSGAMTLERHSVDFSRLVDETAGSIAVLAEERDVRLDIQAPGDLCVTGDAGRLRQVLLILLDNALKHTPDGGTITIRVERASGRVQLLVRDTGPGIDPQDLPHIFDRFYRADRARTGGGTGLGLAIGRWIVEAHGGRINAANAPDGGAVFTVTLPQAS